MVSEQYFEWLGVEPPCVPALDFHEILGEKIRAAAQRSRVRDLFDLYQLATKQFDQNLVRRIAILKCWESNFLFDPITFMENIRWGQYDWADLRRLVRRGYVTNAEAIIQGVQREYRFLINLSPEEIILANDPYKREKHLYKKLRTSFQ